MADASSPTPPRFAFTTVLVALLVLLIAYPFFEFSARSQLAFDALSTLVIVSSVRVAAQSRRLMLIAALLGVPALMIRWSAFYTGSFVIEGLTHALSVLYFGFVTGVILMNVLRSQSVTTDTIVGGVAVYLMTGVIGSQLFALVEHLAPGALSQPSHGRDDPALFLYFSFVTMTTLGYGDVTPTHPVARTLAYLLAVFGQLYVAILIARLVGMHISTDRD